MNSNIFTALTLDDDDDDEVILTPRNRRPDTDLLKFMKALENRKVSKVTPAPAPDIKSLDEFKITGINIELGSRRAAEKGSSLIRPLVWIDLEMTGLDPSKDRILEVACVITDGNLETVITGPDLVIHESEEVLASMNDWCQVHHKESGLVERVRSSTVSLQEAEQQLLSFVKEHTSGEPGSAQVAGNSVYVDLTFIKHHMPELGSLFSHVVIDVSSITSLCKRWYPRDAYNLTRKKQHHRALEDIMESIMELRELKLSIFKRTKGSSEKCRSRKSYS